MGGKSELVMDAMLNDCSRLRSGRLDGFGFSNQLRYNKYYFLLRTSYGRLATGVGEKDVLCACSAFSLSSFRAIRDLDRFMGRFCGPCMEDGP